MKRQGAFMASQSGCGPSRAATRAEREYEIEPYVWSYQEEIAAGPMEWPAAVLTVRRSGIARSGATARLASAFGGARGHPRRHALCFSLGPASSLPRWRGQSARSARPRQL